MYSDYLPPWFEKYGNDLKVVFFDDLKVRPMELTKEICGWLGISPDVFTESDFTVENKTVYYKNKSVHKFILAVNKKLEAFWRRNHSLKKKLRSFYYIFNANKSSGETIDGRTEKLLTELYAPYNQKLFTLLQKNGYTHLPAWITHHNAKTKVSLTSEQH